MRASQTVLPDYTFSMSSGLGALARFFALLALIVIPHAICFAATTTWRGLLRDSGGKPIPDATIVLREQNSSREYTAKTSSIGEFSFADIPPGTYVLRVTSGEKSWTATSPVVLNEGAPRNVLELSAQEQVVRVLAAPQGSSAQASGGERLSSEEVSGLPLIALTFDSAVAAPLKIVVDCSRHVAMRAINSVRMTVLPRPAPPNSPALPPRTSGVNRSMTLMPVSNSSVLGDSSAKGGGS